MAENYFQIDKEDHICTITINRPNQRNAFNTEMWNNLNEIMTNLQYDSQVRVAIITGNGNTFSAGADLAEFLKSSAGGSVTAARDYPVEHCLDSILNYPNPVIAMVNGYALAGGCELAIACDLRIAADTAKFGMPLARVGIMFSYGLAQRLINAFGITLAKEILFTGRMIEAQRAREIGMINEVVPPDQLRSVTMKMAKEIAANAPLSVRGFKTMSNSCLSFWQPPVEADLDAIRSECFASEDAKEGLRAFLEKRKPVFQGR